MEAEYTRLERIEKTSIVFITKGENAVFTAGNITYSNPLGLEYFQPRTLAPVDVDLFGTFLLLLLKKKETFRLLPTSSPPTPFKHKVFHVVWENVDDVLDYLDVAYRRKKIFVPVAVVASNPSSALRLVKKRMAPAYYIQPIYASFLDNYMFQLMKKTSGVRKIIKEKELILPGELSEEKAGDNIIW